MATIPETATTLPSVLAIYDRYTRERGDWRRAHLGASQIGKECERALWYQFRWCTEPQFDGRMLRLFRSGDLAEIRFVEDLRAIGVEVYQHDPETGRQFQVSACGGHFGGSMDGVGVGFQESSKYHLLEFKTSNEKKFNELKKNGVEKAKPEHFAQMQCYMALAELERALYLVVNKNSDELYGARVRYQPKVAERLLEKAARIIEAPGPPPRISNDPSFFLCNWCDHRAICHQQQIPEVSCRTCVHATPETDGDRRWTCARWGKDLSLQEQKEGCDQHLFLPALIPSPVADADEEENSISYDNGIKNGGLGGLDSWTLREVENARDRD